LLLNFSAFKFVVYLRMPVKPIIKLPVIKITDDEVDKTTDALAVEEPLEIRLEYGADENRQIKNVSVTMRTPGNDAELATGFLFTEGIIKHQSDVLSAQHCFIAGAEDKENVIQVNLEEGATPDLKNTDRNFYTTSSCGVCGKGSIESIKTVSAYQNKTNDNQVSVDILYFLPAILQKHQEVFADTGGLHASALFDAAGELIMVREDVGRHNALDKLIGAALNEKMLPLDKHILLLSGRASFELIQKAAMAGINIITAVGAPSSLAVQLAEEFNITLIGFLRGKRFNIYTQPQRILLSKYEDSY
jgi:FdhD protein